MKEAIIRVGPKVEIIDSPVPSPGEDQVLIKVVFSGSNPKDWKYPEPWMHGKKGEINQGDDIAGTIAKVGKNVTEFKVGDRVGAFHEMHAPHGSYAEYAVAWASTTFHIAENVSFEEAATIPLAAMTATVGMFSHRFLDIPPPWSPQTSTFPIVIYGGASAIGAFAIQLAVRANLHPIIAIAGNGADFVSSFLDKSKGDTIVDYRAGDDAIIKGVTDALAKSGANAPFHCFDGVSASNSWQNIGKAFSSLGGGVITTVLPPGDDKKPFEGVELRPMLVSYVHQFKSPEKGDFGYVYFRYLARGLKEGWFKAHPYKVVPGGLNGVEEGLKGLKEGKNSAHKYIFKIADTEGAGKD